MASSQSSQSMMMVVVGGRVNLGHGPEQPVDPNLNFSHLPKPPSLKTLGGPENGMPTPAATLRASLERHNETFESLLKLIPAKYYIVQDQTEEQVNFLWSHNP
jgi:hypothetical protein